MGQLDWTCTQPRRVVVYGHVGRRAQQRVEYVVLAVAAQVDPFESTFETGFSLYFTSRVVFSQRVVFT